LGETTRVEGLVSFAKVAADFHSSVAFEGLICLAVQKGSDQIACDVAERHRAGPLVTLVETGFDVARPFALAGCLAGDDGQRTESGERLATYSWVDVRNAAPPARLTAWPRASMVTDRRARMALTDSAPAPRDFVCSLTRFANAEGSAAHSTAVAETVEP
jgi:hypothetical protein